MPTNTKRRLTEKPEDLNDQVNHPPYYGGDDTYEVIKVLEAWGLTENALLFNCVKYIARAGKKNGAPYELDLKKAAWYLMREITNIELRKIT